MNMVNQNDKENNDKKDKGNEGNSLEQYYVPVQEYTGEGFELNGANPKTGEIAEANRDEVEGAVKDYFLQHYKTEVKVNNIVSAKDGVSVFVESVGELEFYTKAIVPIDVNNVKVEVDHVWSLEGEIKRDIASALYVRAFEEEFAELDDLLNRFAKEYSLEGESMDMKAKVRGGGYNTPYYSVKSGFWSLNDLYYENPKVTGKELKDFIRKEDYILSEANTIAIRFYMNKSNEEPSKEIIDKIYEEITNVEGLPGGRYAVILNDNLIDSRRANGENDKTIRHVIHMEGEL